MIRHKQNLLSHRLFTLPDRKGLGERRLKLMCLFLPVAIFLVGCGKDTPSKDVTAKADVYIETDTTLDLCLYNTDTLNPLVTSVKQNAEVLSCLYDSLFTVTAEFDAVPDLCTEYGYSGNNTVFYAKIKEGVTFQDGTLLTVQDVVASVRRILSSNGYYKTRLAKLLDAFSKGNTLYLTFSEPVKQICVLLDFPILPNGGLDDTSSVLAPPAPGSGIFHLEEYQTGNRLCLTPNLRHHSGALPYFSSAVIHMTNSRKTAVTMMENGVIDVLPLENDPIPEHVFALPYPGCRYVFLGTKDTEAAEQINSRLSRSGYLPQDAVSAVSPLHPASKNRLSENISHEIYAEQVEIKEDMPPTPMPSQSKTDTKKLFYCESVSGRRLVAEGIAKELSEHGIVTEAVGIDLPEYKKRMDTASFDLILGEVLLLPDFCGSLPDFCTIGLYFASEYLLHDSGFLHITVSTLNPYKSIVSWIPHGL